MNQFIVVFSEPFDDTTYLGNALITDKYQMSDRILLVRSVLDSAQQVATQFGISNEPSPCPPVSGVVLKLEGSYYGYNDPALWTWLSGAHVSYSAG